MEKNFDEDGGVHVNTSTRRFIHLTKTISSLRACKPTGFEIKSLMNASRST